MPNFQIETAPSCADAQEPGVLSVAQARERILRDTAVLSGEERVDLRSALGRTLCRDVISPMNVPGYDNSAMDGYALPGDQLPENAFVDLDVIGTIHAGGRFDARCGPGQCVRIMTGAAMPDGTDTVVMQEQVMVLEGERIRVGSGHRTGQNVRLAGEDIPAGSVVIHTGKTLLPADIGILASVGVSEVSVRRRARVAFFSTGDELKGIGETLAKGDLYDSNRYSLYGMLKRLDVELLDLGVIRDEPDALKAAFSQAARLADVVISSGGVSVGEADYTRPILEAMGRMNFWKIAMKPGRPLAFGNLGEALFFGLPGNPVAVMVTFYQFVLPALHRLITGESVPPLILGATASEQIRKRPGRYEFLRGIFSANGDGTFSVRSVGRQGSGILTSMSRANCFILLDEECAGVEPGDLVQIQPFAGLV